MEQVALIVADDHPIFRAGLLQILEKEPALEVVAEVGDGDAVLTAIDEFRSDVLVLDLDLPGKTGLDIARQLFEIRDAPKIVILTGHNDVDLFNEAMDLGVMGYVLKDCAVSDLVAALRHVMEGKPYISPTISSYVLDRHQRASGLSKAHPGLAELTSAEKRVLKMISNSLTSKEIADRLHLSPRTIENQRASICDKLGLHGAHSLVKFAFEHKSSF